MFDPYGKWLGIRAERRPVDYYQLLDVDPDDADAATIEQAAQRQADKLRRHQDGPRSDTCTRVLKEIERAEDTLRDPAKRKQYDMRQRKASSGKDQKETQESSQITGKISAMPRRDGAAKSQPRTAQAAEVDAPRPSRVWLWLGLGSAAALLLVVGVVAVAAFWLLTRQTPVAPATPIAFVSPPEPTPPPIQPPEPPPENKPEPPKNEPAPPPPPMPPPPPVIPVIVPPAPKFAKFPVPSAEEQARAEKELRELYKADYAKTDKLDKLIFAGKLLQPGRENRKDHAAWYVLLREARDLAVQGNGPRLAVAAIQEMDQFFIIDAAEMNLKALTTIAQAPGAPAAAAVAETALGLESRAVNDDQFDAARKLIATAESALSLVPKTKLKLADKHIKLVATRKTQLAGFEKERQVYLAAKKKLDDAPAVADPKLADPKLADAKVTVGKYLCFSRGQWDDGLPLLLQGSDGLIKAIAKEDVARPAKVDRQMILANDWWEQSRAHEGRNAFNLRRRAKFWYERAGETAGAIDRVKVGQRIKDIDFAESARILRLVPGSYFGRGIEDRVLLLREGGGTMRSEQAVERGLEWLSRHQSPNGMWSNDAFGLPCNCRDPGHKFDVAGTAFGLLPFLGAGQTHKTGPYGKTVYKGLAYLLSVQKKEGNFSDNMYENALASIAVCEAYGMTRDPLMRTQAQAAVAFIIRAQHIEGGWGYSPGAKGDTSVTGWQFTALKAGVYAGLPVPDATFDQLSRYLDTVEDPAALGYGYNSPGAARATSSVGLLCREFLGWGPAHPRLAKGVKQLFQPENFPSKDRLSIYFIFYATQLVHHAGGKNWEEWNPKVRDLLIELQDQGTERLHQAGSWPPHGDDYAAQGGRLMFTSLALLTLEVYYYHIPLYNYGPTVSLD